MKQDFEQDVTIDANNAPVKTSQTSVQVGLVGDIGGTNARFAIARIEGGRPVLVAPRDYLSKDFDSAESAAKAYLADHPEYRPTVAALAVAGPVLDGQIRFTNTDWTISEKGFASALGLSSATLLNDFAALVMATPILGAEDLHTVGPAITPRAHTSMAALGAGTGLGVSCLVRNGVTETVATSEGGHMSLAAVDEAEVEIWRWLTAQFGRVSAERILSGPGLLNLYHALCDIHGSAPDCATPADVTLKARSGDAVAQATREQFCKFLGSFAGDVALVYGALGGVYLGGGLNRHFMDVIDNGLFRSRFEAKGRFESYMKAIPTLVILHPHTSAQLGAARALHEAGCLS
jgi:glucokinase